MEYYQVRYYEIFRKHFASLVEVLKTYKSDDETSDEYRLVNLIRLTDDGLEFSIGFQKFFIKSEIQKPDEKGYRGYVYKTYKLIENLESFGTYKMELVDLEIYGNSEHVTIAGRTEYTEKDKFGILYLKTLLRKI